MEGMVDLSLDVSQSVRIDASSETAFRSLLDRLSKDNSTPDNRPMPMVLEEWPGGRWFRDLGDGQGHLWGHVQVIKPPTLIEIVGPMFMSYAVAGHLQLRLTADADGCELSLRHQVLGLVEPEHREGLNHGWGHLLNTVKADAER